MIENTAVLETAFMTGTIDYVAGELGLTVDQGLELEARRAYSFDFAIRSSLNYTHVDVNLDDPLLAIDRTILTQRLFDALMAELDPEKRKPIWAGIQNAYARELPALPLYFESTVFVIPTWLKGVDPAGHLGNTTQWVEEWRAD